MSRDDGSCYPGLDLLAIETGLSEASVSKHLKLAKKTGWISITRRPGKDWRRHLYTLSVERSSTEARSTEARSTEPNRGSLELGSGDHLIMNQTVTRGTLELGSAEPSSSETLPIHVEPPPSSVPRPGDPRTLRAVAQTARSQQIRPGTRSTGKQGRTGAPSLSSSDLINGLRAIYPHPTNRGAPRVVPQPLAIEKWLKELITKGSVGVDDFPAILDGAKGAAVLAKRHPELFRRGLRTWLSEGGWGEEVEEDATASLSIPPPSTRPLYTPTNWNKPTPTQLKDPNGIMDNRRGT